MAMPPAILAVAAKRFAVQRGELGDNVTTPGLDPLGLSTGTRRRLGARAVVVTGGTVRPRDRSAVTLRAAPHRPLEPVETMPEAPLDQGPFTFMGLPCRIDATGAGAATAGFGGDASVSLPLSCAVSRVHPALAVLHVDGHTDASPIDPVHRYDAATPFAHAALAQRVRTSASWHVGLRGTTYRPGVYAHARELGYDLVTMADFTQRAAEEGVGIGIQGQPPAIR